MKPRSLNFPTICTLTLCVLGAGPALAQDSWDGGGTPDGGNYNWNDGANWIDDSAPIGGVLNFGGVVNPTTFNNNTAGTLFGAINFTNNGTLGTEDASFILNGNQITLNDNIGTTAIVAGGAVITNVINLDMILNGDRSIGTSGAGNGTGSHNIIVNGIISEAGSPRALAKGGNFPSGTLTLAGNNTYTGFTVIETGTVTVSKIADSGESNLGYGSQITLSFGGATGTLNYTGSGSTTSRMVQLGSSNLLQLGGTAGGAINANGANGGTGLVFDAPTFIQTVSSTVTSRTLTLQGSNTDANKISGKIIDVETGVLPADTTATNLTKSQAGRWILTGDNTYTGATSITAGNLNIRHANALGSTAAGTTVSNLNTGAQLEIEGNGISFAAEALTLTSGNSGVAMLRNVSGDNTWNGSITATTVAGTGNLARIQSDAGTLTLAGTMSGAGADNSFVFQGAGNIDVTGSISGAIRVNSGATGGGVRSLSGGNSYGGSTTVGGGVLRLNHATAIPGGIALSGGTSNINLAGGILGLGNGNLTRALGTGLDQIQLTAANSGFAAYTADRIVNLSSAAALTWGSGSFITAGSTFVLGHSTSTHMVDFQNAINMGGTGRTFIVNDGSSTVDGKLSGTITGTNFFSKAGAGTLELSGSANSWTNTFVDSGTLRLGASNVLPGAIELKRAAATDTNPVLDLNGFSDTVGTVTLGISAATATNNGQNVSIINSAGGTAALTLGSDLTYRSGVSGLFANGQATISANLATGNANRNFVVGDGSATNDLVISGVISGSGVITKTVGGTLLLSGANTYTGQLNISAGTVKLGADNALPDAVTNIVQLGINATNSNVVLDINGFSDTVGPLRINGASGGAPGTVGLTHSIIDSAGGGVLTLGNTFNVYAGGAIQYGQATISANLNTGNPIRNLSVENSTAAPIDLLISGTIVGANGFVKLGAGTLALSAANTYSGVTTANAGVLQLQNNLALQNSTLNADFGGTGTVTLDAGITTPTFGGLAGTRDLGALITGGYGNVTALTLNPNSGSVTYDGVIADGTSGMTLTKTGAGTQVLSNTCDYTGSTNVNDGKLLVNGNISTSALTTVNSGGTLGGDGTVGTASILSGGALAPGNSIGTLNFSDTLSLAGISNFEIDPTILGLNLNADRANVNNGVTYGGTLNVQYGGLNSNFANGMIFNLFDASSFAGSFATVNLPTLTGGLSWKNDLLANGTLAVIPEPRAVLLGAIGLLALLRRRRN